MISRFLRFVLVTALFFAALGLRAAKPVSAADPVDLFNNLYEDYGGYFAIDPPIDPPIEPTLALAQPFTTTSGNKLIMIALRLSKFADTTGNYSVEIWDNSGTDGGPGVLVPTVGVVATADTKDLSEVSIGSANPIVYFAGLDITLALGKTYYVVVRSANTNGLDGLIYWDTITSPQIGTPLDAVVWDGSSWIVAPGFQCQMRVISDSDPTAVRMAGAAVASNPGGGLQIQWTSFSEIDTTGYVIARADSPSGTFTRLTPGLIPAQVPGTEGGSAYAWIDASAKPGQRYTYRISMLSTAQNEIDMLLTEGGYYQTYLSFFRH